MIANRSDLNAYLKADLHRYDTSASVRGLLSGLARQPQARFVLRLRLAEYIHNAKSGLLWRAIDIFARWRLQAAGRRLGYTIPVNTFGPGLKLPHWGTIVIGGEAAIGANCTCHPGVLVGTHRNGTPVIGDDVYLGNGAKLYGPIKIGDGAVVAPNSVVTRDIEPGDRVGGIPAVSLRTRS